MASPLVDDDEGCEQVSLQSTHNHVGPLVPPSDEKKTVNSTLNEANSDPLEDQYPPPTDEENRTLRKVSANVPLVSFSLCLVEFAERASYYGARTVFANFIEFPLPNGGNGAGAPPRGTQQTAGALGMGLQASSALTLLFSFLAYVIPLFGGWWADVHIGRYKAIMVGVLICGLAHIIQLVGAIPSVLQKGQSHAAPPFIIGLLLLAFGAGIFKPNIIPTVLDQNRHQRPYTKQLKSGEKVIVDPPITMTRTTLIFYGFVNVGAFYMLPCTYSEKYVGYWLSFLLTAVIYLMLPLLLLGMYTRTYKQPPSGTADFIQALSITKTALIQSRFRIWHKDFWDFARSPHLESKGLSTRWTDDAVSDVSRAMTACDIFCFFPIYYLSGGIGSVQANQGAAMITNGVPNDVLDNFNALTLITAVPTLTFIIYPMMNRRNIKFGPISRMTLGFILAVLSGVCGALVQWQVYKQSPCGYSASTCDRVAPISIWWQLPTTILSALSECFCNVTAYEVAYSRAPKSMRGTVVAVYLFMSALSSALGEIMIPVTKDPWLIWIWAAPPITLFPQTMIFWYRFHHIDNDIYAAATASVAEEKVKEGTLV
ncbi:hypothetical protein N7533_006222 [Penicillium manginii]|uniref:uncharacterized protein n=1 Tax=Penicillium manginii TaxID=203109 RepID=UPI002547FF76|nr:uncharacterized protein N7533_006222 [Penicillium manginii]KAJ5756679.1 hypothetical protein N7533_006222 [Penicillium manginii]